MICRILLLISLNCVCGTFVVNVTQTSYQAEKNHNITLEWMFTTTTVTSPNSLYIFCEMRTDHTGSVLFHLHGGVEVPESQDRQFVGRVQCDKDVLRDGRLRLHVSRLRTEDSGLYTCDVRTNYGVDFGDCRLNVSAAMDWSEPESLNTDTPERPNTDTPESLNTDTPEGLKWPIWGTIAFFSVVGLAVVVVSVIYLLNIHFLSVEQDCASDSRRGLKKSYSSTETEETV
ncbi:uncharacterized protein [Pagrus major]|uniref:uncharacterized protein n=1 Tax=Pagrus major TaxID=143350 RepID=UPI003CC8BC04